MPNSPANRIRVAVVSGGRSGEHEISLRSASSIKRALDEQKYQIVDYFIDKTGHWHPSAIVPEPDGNPEIDVVFPVLHGPFGEDGTIQGLLELAALPYVGAGVLGSALAMDKAMTKRVSQQAGLPVVDYVVLTREQLEIDSFVSPFPYPVFVKPVNLGSSVGITKAKDDAELQTALKTAADFDSRIIVERGIVGREFECGVLGGVRASASTPCEIIPSQDFYNYEDKYILNTARIELPAKLDAGKTEEMQRLAILAFEAAGCEGMARVDFLMDATSAKLYVNEINTIPGFTSISMYPKMWEYSGIPYAELLDRLIRLALDRAEQKQRTRAVL
ncbi:MAG TPA: D-alanine--D-alanine ligase family protein [Bryobacteraceae bacterium]|nr:D-alanine--D-alanine ligase family protein [Bryobacteraceae bacterium]